MKNLNVTNLLIIYLIAQGFSLTDTQMVINDSCEETLNEVTNDMFYHYSLLN